jgi:hypothetical protein
LASYGDCRVGSRAEKAEHGTRLAERPTNAAKNQKEFTPALLRSASGELFAPCVARLPGSPTLDQVQCRSFVNCDVIGLVAFDQILRLFFGSMVHISFVGDIRRHFPNDDTTHRTCL